MQKINVVIDGSWLFKACGPDCALAYKTDAPDYPFKLSWTGLNALILKHVSEAAGTELEYGERYISTSIFTLPDDFDNWPEIMPGVTDSQIERTKRSVHARSKFVQGAMDAGFMDTAIHRPLFRNWMFQRLEDGNYQEKQVDTTVVALLVRSAITQPDNYHVLLTGDADMIPAIKLAYPEYSKNVCVVSTHPDELDSVRRQTSASYIDFNFTIPPLYLQEHAGKLMAGAHIHQCVECGKVFSTLNAIPRTKQARCMRHRR